MLEKNIGRKIKLLNNGNTTAENDDANDNFEETDEECEPVSMQETQDKCMVSALFSEVQICYALMI